MTEFHRTAVDNHSEGMVAPALHRAECLYFGTDIEDAGKAVVEKHQDVAVLAAGHTDSTADTVC